MSIWSFDDSINKVLESGNYILGEQVEYFEKEFAKYNDVNFALGVGSGTEALHISLRALGVGEQDDDLQPFDAENFTNAFLKKWKNKLHI